MVEEKVDIENEIYDLCDEINTINKENIEKFKSGMIAEERIVYVTRKLQKFKKYINNSELVGELVSKKNKLNEKLNMILVAESTIKDVLNDDSDNYSEIDSRFESIINTIEEIEPIVNNLIDLTAYIPREGIKNNIQLYKRELNKLSRSFSDLGDKTTSEFLKIKQKGEVELQQISAKHEEFKINIDDKLYEYNNKIIELQEIVNQKKLEIETLKEDYNKEIEQLQKSYSDRIIEFEEQANKDFDNLKMNIEKKDKKISELIGLIGNKANIGEYKSNADKAHKERIVWQVLTVIIFVIAFGMMCLITLKTKDYNITTLARYIVSVILLGMSGYTAKQASNQRKDEIYFRKQQLELSSMDVYLDDMPDNIKQEIKQSLSNKIFGQARETYKNKYDESANNSIEKLVGLIEDLIHRQK